MSKTKLVTKVEIPVTKVGHVVFGTLISTARGGTTMVEPGNGVGMASGQNRPTRYASIRPLGCATNARPTSALRVAPPD